MTADQQYLAQWFETYGGPFAAAGYGKRSGASIEFEFRYPNRPSYTTSPRDVTTAGQTFRTGSKGKDGRRTPFA